MIYLATKDYLGADIGFKIASDLLEALMLSDTTFIQINKTDTHFENIILPLDDRGVVLVVGFDVLVTVAGVRTLNFDH